MPLFSPDESYGHVGDEQPETKHQSPLARLANGMVIKQNEFANFELWKDGRLLGTYTHPEGVWGEYRRRVFTEGDEIALHGLGVSLGRPLPEPKVEKLPWEVHAVTS